MNANEIKISVVREMPTTKGDEPEKIAQFWREHVATSDWYNSDREHFCVFHLDIKHRIKNWELISIGTLDATIVHPRDVFRSAIIVGAASIIVAHNHPSGDTTQSKADVNVTQNLIKAGEILKIQVLDSLIISDTDEYNSLREKGYFYKSF